MARSKKRSTKSVKQKTRLIALLLGVVLVGVGVNAVRNWYKIQHAGVPASHVVATVSTDTPSEQPVPASYSVPADKPLSIEMPSIKAKGFIQQVGVDKKNQMVAPGNVNMAGWYVKSVLPGDKGLSIIDGHVNGLYAKGVFYNLGKLKSGDEFRVTFGDKSIRKFKVVGLKTVTTEEANTELFVRDNKLERQLNLITCAGKYDKSSRTYDSRVIVTASSL